MDGIYTIPYPEFCVAQQLSRLLTAKRGYSVFAPLSRQQPGVDLVLVRRARSGSKVATIQVKGSRTYSRPKATARTKHPFLYYTWWAPQVLLFSQVEMRRSLRTVSTVAGHPDKMFGFGFDTPESVPATRRSKAPIP